MKHLIRALIGLAAVAGALVVYDCHRDGRRAQEVSMFRFLTFHLQMYEEQAGEFPKTLEDGIESGLLDRFPINRIDLFREAYEDGRFRYTRSEEVGFRLWMVDGDQAMYAEKDRPGRWERWGGANQPKSE